MTTLQPKEIEIEKKKFIISKIPALDGYEILMRFPRSILSGDYANNKEMVCKVLSYVGIPREGQEPLLLNTEPLINSHCSNTLVLILLTREVLSYNCDFFLNEQLSTFCAGAVQNIESKLVQMLARWSMRLSALIEPHSTN